MAQTPEEQINYEDSATAQALVESYAAEVLDEGQACLGEMAAGSVTPSDFNLADFFEGNETLYYADDEEEDAPVQV